MLAYEEVGSGNVWSSHLFKFKAFVLLNKIKLSFYSTESDLEDLSCYTQDAEPEPFYSRAFEDHQRLDDPTGGHPDPVGAQSWYKKVHKWTF